MATIKKESQQRKTTKAKKDDGIYWVISVRNKLFGWTPIGVAKTRDEAEAQRNLLEEESFLGIRYAKVDRVDLVGGV